MADNCRARTLTFDRGRRTIGGHAGLSRVLIFEVAGRLFALPIEDVLEIVPVPLMGCEPGERDGLTALAGIINLGGTAVPVLHTERLLGLPDSPVGLHTPVIIVRGGARGDERFGLLADSVRGIAVVDRDELLALPTQGVSTTAVRVDEWIIPIIVLADLLLIQERERIQEVRRARQRRLSSLEEAPA